MNRRASPVVASIACRLATTMLILLLPFGSAGAQDFRRGDSNGDGVLDLSDAVATLGFQFLRSPTRLACRDAADVNDDGAINIADPIFILGFFFIGGPPHPPPGSSCGSDPTPESLSCDLYEGCFVPPPPASVQVTPLDIDFGPVGVGMTSAQQIVSFRNLGSVTLGSFAGGAPFDTQFGASQNCAGGVAPGESCQYFFTFRPTRAGIFNTTSNSSTNAGSFVIRLRGRGRALRGALALCSRPTAGMLAERSLTALEPC